ncbi:hypothetical protein FGO68_gene6219 [Halteria grandinella]|uniref:Uncharacterized protein n=1 Tax=Halteria grandinella TaxID=5974 RepID=A0A8J8SWE1_HALGN|nr:hypothetical protein FGO68_gene6219 [Halteria grandinella]
MNTDFNSTAMLNNLDQYLNLNGTVNSNTGPTNGFSNQPIRSNNTASEEEQIKLQQLMNDLNNIRENQRSCGLTPVGDLFRGRVSDIEETIHSLYQMIKARIADQDYRAQAREKLNKMEMERGEASDQVARLRAVNEKLQNENKELKNQLTSMDLKFKQERERFTQQLDELNKRVLQVTSKETQYKHEIKSKEQVIDKLKDTYRKKMFDQAKPQSITGSLEILQYHTISATGQQQQTVGAVPTDTKYSSMDFQLMISRSQDDIVRRVCDENGELKECLKALQKEMFDIVDLKATIYRNRFEAELSSHDASTPFDAVRHDLDKIREELFSLPFDQAGRELVVKFQRNFSKLRDFMERVDRDIAQLSVFSASRKGDDGENGENEEMEYGDENGGDYANEVVSPKGTRKQAKKAQPPRKFKGISTVGQLKHLLRNYDALVEGQHSLLNQSISKMAKIPPADELTSTFQRFQLLKDSELDEMRRFIEDNKSVMAAQYKEFEHERRQFEEMNQRMEGEKMRISEERERVEAEVRRIRELNREMTQSLHLSTK